MNRLLQQLDQHAIADSEAARIYGRGVVDRAVALGYAKRLDWDGVLALALTASGYHQVTMNAREGRRQ